MRDIYYMSGRSNVYVPRNFNHYIIVQCSDGFHWLSLDCIRSFSNLLEEAANFLTMKAVLCLSTIDIIFIVYRFVHVLFFLPSGNLEAYIFFCWMVFPCFFQESLLLMVDFQLPQGPQGITGPGRNIQRATANCDPNCPGVWPRSF